MNIAKQPRAVLATLIAAVLVPVAQAADSGWYVSAGISQAKSDISKRELDAAFLDPTVEFYQYYGVFGSASSTLDDSDTAWDLMFGYRFNPYVAVEGGYTNLGTARYTGTVMATDTVVTEYDNLHARFKSSGLVAALVGSIPIGQQWDVHGRLGLYRAKTKFDSNFDYLVVFPDSTQQTGSGPIDAFSASTTEYLYGIGTSLKVGEQWRFSLDWTRYDSVGDKNKTGEANVDTLGLKAAFYLASQGHAPRAKKTGEGWYVTAGFGQSSIDVNRADADSRAAIDFASRGGTVQSSTLDDSSNAFSVGVGYQLNSNFAIEGSYVNLGEATYTANGSALLGSPTQEFRMSTTMKGKSSGLALSGIGIVPTSSHFQLHGRVGIYLASNKFDEEIRALPSASSSREGTTQELLFGVGADWRLAPSFSLGIDWTRYNDVGDNNDTPEATFDVLSLSGKVYF